MLTGAVLVTTSVGVGPASAHYVPPPGEDEAAPAVVQVQVDYNYAVFLAGKAGERERFAAVVPGPRGTGAVVNSSGGVLTGAATGSPGRTQREEIIAINQAFRDRYGQSWTDAQLAGRQRLADREANRALQACYARTTSCAAFEGRTRTVVFNTEPVRRLNARYVPLGTGLGLLSTQFDRARTPTVGVAAAAPDAGGEYRALGWGQDALLPSQPVTFENGAFRAVDLQKVGSTFANGGDGVVIVDNKSRGTVVAVVIRGADGKPSTVEPFNTLQFANVGTDRGPLHPSIDQALGYFQGQHYAHAVPLLQQVTTLLPDRGLLAKQAIAQKEKGGPKDKSEVASEMGTQAVRSFPWSTLAAVVGVVLLGAALALLWWRRRRRGQPPDDGQFDEDDNEDLDELIEEQPVAGEPQPDHAAGALDRAGGGTMEHGDQQPSMVSSPVEAADQASGYCAQCGVGMLAGDRFCYHCGTPAR
jgi:hypothetical protein